MRILPTERKILKALDEAEDALPIIEIAKLTDIHRVTISKYLAGMEDKQLVECRSVGKAKLYALKRA